jgi:hypothetical protein
MTTSVLTSPLARMGVGLAIGLAASLLGASSLEPPSDAIPIDNDDLAGIVRSPRGPRLACG